MPWIFELSETFQPHYGRGVDSASKRNEYQESSWGGGRRADNLTVICEPILYLFISHFIIMEFMMMWGATEET
jgi:hypothetical protein